MDNILRHIAITVVAVVAMILCVLSGTDIVFAQGVTYIKEGQTYVVKSNQWETNDDFSIEYQFDSPTGSPMVFVWAKRPDNAIDTLYAYSLEPFNVSANLTSGQSGVSAVSSEADLMNSSYTSGYELYYRSLNFVMYSSPLSTYEFNWTPSDCVPYYYYEVSDSGYWKEVCDSVRNLLSNGDTSGFDCTYSGISGTLENPIYSTDIGALTGMADLYRSYVEMGDQDSSAVVTERTHHFGWNKMTTTNVNLLKNDYDDVKVQCGIKLRDVVRKNWVTQKEVAIDNDDLKQIFFTSPDATASKLFMEVKNTYLVNDILTSKIRPIIASTGYDTAFWNVNYTYDFYFRICAQKNGKWYYGNYVRLDKLGSSEKVITGGTFDVSSTEVSVNEDGTLTDTDNTETGTGATGTGDSYEEAKNDADRVSGDIDVDIDDYISNISTLADEIKSIPDIIAKIFSFLPDWVLTLIALSIGTIAVLMVIKFIRG